MPRVLPAFQLRAPASVYTAERYLGRQNPFCLSFYYKSVLATTSVHSTPVYLGRQLCCTVAAASERRRISATGPLVSASSQHSYPVGRETVPTTYFAGAGFSTREVRSV